MEGEPTRASLSEGPGRDQSGSKVYNDPIHGQISLDRLLVKIVDTRQFQRLRFIKQMGCKSFVYPGAVHTRFEHSIGTCHLAHKYVKSIRRSQPELGITDEDALCVKIGALCHDLGHGPFSHVFDSNVTPRLPGAEDWKHEDGSIMMFDHLLETHPQIREELECGRDGDNIEFIREIIRGTSKDGGQVSYGSSTRDHVGYVYTTECQLPELPNFSGRSKDKWFLYEIVANKLSGIDVDKWDYFVRDCYYLGVGCSFQNFKRFIQFSRVIEVDGRRHICYREKLAVNLYEMFSTRVYLHQTAIQHSTARLIQRMVADALVLGYTHLVFEGKDGKMRNLAEAIHDPVAFGKLTDDVFTRVLYSSGSELAESRALLERILERRMYPHSRALCAANKNEAEIKSKADDAIGALLDGNDFDTEMFSIDYGQGSENPISKVFFFKKSQPNKVFQLDPSQVSATLPVCFQDLRVMLFYKKEPTQEDSEKLRGIFARFELSVSGSPGHRHDDSESENEQTSPVDCRPRLTEGI